MNVLADLHHGDLYHSLRMLFEGRLGWNLYRPTGMDWFTRGYWKYNDNIPTARQYLRSRNEDVDKGDHFLCSERPHNEIDKALTFKQFLDKDIDIIIASVFQHEEPYRKLIEVYKPKAKLIRQTANIHDVVNPSVVKNILSSCILDVVPPNINVVEYHQEFDLNVFKYRPPFADLKIKNFMNCLPDSRDIYLWPRYKAELSNFDWKMFGILGEDGIIGSVSEIAREMQESSFVWHVKFGGDGFGHVIHNAFACGRPVITKASYYQNCMAGALLEDGVTCIDLDKGSFEENIEKIKFFSEPKRLLKMCENVRRRFDEVVNYDEEFKNIKKFLDNLI